MNKKYWTIEDFVEANNNAYRLSQNGKFLEAKPYIDEAVRIAGIIVSSPVKINNLSAKDYAKVFAMAGFIYGELEDADASLYLYQHFQFLKTQLRHGFPNCDNLTLYQFRSNKPYIITNLKENQFTFASPREQNDIVDSPIFAWLDFILGKQGKYNKHILYLKQSFDGYRIASFCRDSETKRAIENTLMWAHYADCHKGFCIQYHLDSSDFRRDKMEELSASRLFPVDYLSKDDCVLDLSDPNNTLSSKRAYFTKSVDWQYENEVRMVSYNPLNTAKYPEFKLGSKSNINAIYFGVNCPDSTKEEIRNALVGRNIRYFQMAINPRNIYSLIDKEIL
ncbi:MAG: DUF2971 domain-containing protein [Bacteroides sp.]|nr:DUF2971 domain-containing protein [Bacteroides sp.]